MESDLAEPAEASRIPLVDSQHTGVAGLGVVELPLAIETRGFLQLLRH